MPNQYTATTNFRFDEFPELEKYSMNMKIEWEYTNSEIIERKGFGKELNKYMAETVAFYTEPYVPWGPNHIAKKGHVLSHEGGTLSRSRRIYANKKGGTIVWTAQYADYQYRGEDNSKKGPWQRYHAIHPKSTSHWNEAAWQYHSGTIERKVDTYRRSLSKP